MRGQALTFFALLAATAVADEPTLPVDRYAVGSLFQVSLRANQAADTLEASSRTGGTFEQARDADLATSEALRAIQQQWQATLDWYASAPPQARERCPPWPEAPVGFRSCAEPSASYVSCVAGLRQDAQLLERGDSVARCVQTAWRTVLADQERERQAEEARRREEERRRAEEARRQKEEQERRVALRKKLDDRRLSLRGTDPALAKDAERRMTEELSRRQLQQRLTVKKQLLAEQQQRAEVARAIEEARLERERQEREDAERRQAAVLEKANACLAGPASECHGTSGFLSEDEVVRIFRTLLARCGRGDDQACRRGAALYVDRFRGPENVGLRTKYSDLVVAGCEAPKVMSDCTAAGRMREAAGDRDGALRLFDVGCENEDSIACDAAEAIRGPTVAKSAPEPAAAPPSTPPPAAAPPPKPGEVGDPCATNACVTGAWCCASVYNSETSKTYDLSTQTCVSKELVMPRGATEGACAVKRGSFQPLVDFLDSKGVKPAREY